MADGKNSFILYTDCKESVELLSNEKAGQLFKHILRYVNDEDPKLNDKEVLLVFVPIKQQLKRDLRKWDGIRADRSKAGKASAEKRRQQNSTNSTHVDFVQQRSTNPTVTVNDNVNDNVNVNDSVSEETRTRTIDEDGIYELSRTKEMFFSASEDELLMVVVRDKNCTKEQAEALRQKFWHEQEALKRITTRPYSDLKRHFINWQRHRKIETGNGNSKAQQPRNQHIADHVNQAKQRIVDRIDSNEPQADPFAD